MVSFQDRTPRFFPNTFSEIPVKNVFFLVIQSINKITDIKFTYLENKESENDIMTYFDVNFYTKSSYEF